MPGAQTERIARKFCDCTLPKEEWTHEAHLRVGLWYLLRFAPAEAMDRLRDGIRRYNEATGVANTEDSGYHETITRLYVVLIACFLEDEDPSRPIDSLAARVVEALGDQKRPLTFYSKDLLMSKEARARWVEPDVAPLPDVAGGGLGDFR